MYGRAVYICCVKQWSYAVVFAVRIGEWRVDSVVLATMLALSTLCCYLGQTGWWALSSRLVRVTGEELYAKEFLPRTNIADRNQCTIDAMYFNLSNKKGLILTQHCR
jgi:hypothetical protein